MATVSIHYKVPDNSAKEFVDAILDSAGTNAEYILWNLKIEDKKHIDIPVQFEWTYDNEDEVAGLGRGSMTICGDGMGCECE